MKRSLVALACVASLSACGTTEGLVIALGAAGGIISSMTSSPDYTTYAEKCKDIIMEARQAAQSENAVLVEVAKDTKMNSQVLLYLAMKPKTTVFERCALALPEGFLSQLAKSGNILNFVATVYGINRDSINDRKYLEAQKELGFAELDFRLEMQELENALRIRQSNDLIRAVGAGAAAGKGE